MRLAVMSDIHGNLPALEAVLSDLEQYQTDGIIQSLYFHTTTHLHWTWLLPKRTSQH